TWPPTSTRSCSGSSATPRSNRAACRHPTRIAQTGEDSAAVAEIFGRMPSLSPQRLAELQTHANDVRQGIIRSLVAAGSGHSGGSLDMADIFTALYFEILRHDPKNPDWPERDRLLLSCGP